MNEKKERVSSYCCHILLPTVLPLWEALLEVLFWYGVQLVYCILYDVFSCLKCGPFQWHFQLGEKQEVTGSHVRRIGRVMNPQVFWQETLIKCEEWASVLLWWSCKLPAGLAVCVSLHQECGIDPLGSTPWW